MLFLKTTKGQNNMIHEKKIVLFSPKSDKVDFFEGAPLPLLAISRFLALEGYVIKIISATPEFDYVLKILENVENSICLGITSMTGYQIHDGLKVAKAVKQKYPDIPIVWGGWHPSIFPNQTVSNPFVDVVVRGQGEITFTELVHNLEKNMPLNNIKGITYKANGKIIENPERLPDNINNFPPMPYNLIDKKNILRISEYGSRTIDYISSLGCPHRCAFCADFRINKSRWNGLKAERVVEDLVSFVRDYGIDAVVIHDSNFFVDEQRIVKICKGILEKGIKVKLGQPNGRTEQLLRYDEDTWKLMKESGFDQILVGAESGSQQVLDFICKDARVTDTLRLAEICKRYDVGIYLSLMLGFPNAQGFNQDVQTEFNQTLRMIDEVLSTGVRLNIVGWFLYTPYPGSWLYEVSVKSGFREPKDFEEWSTLSLTGNNTPWIPKKYSRLLNQLSTYIFPCFGDTYLRNWANKPDGISKTITILMLRMLHTFSIYRWKHKFFSFMIEARLINFYINNGKNLLYQNTVTEKN